MNSASQFVRPATVDDAGIVAKIQAASLSLLGVDVSVAQLTDPWVEAITTQAEDRTVLVAIEDGQVTGFAAVVDGEIVAFDVLQEQQGRGHGSRLLSAVAEFRGRGELRMWLLPEQESLIRFMTGAGFGPSGQQRPVEGPNGPTTQHLWHAEV